MELIAMMCSVVGLIASVFCILTGEPFLIAWGVGFGVLSVVTLIRAAMLS